MLSETIWLYVALSAYALAFGFAVFGLMFKADRARALSVAALAGGLAAETVAISARWIAIGHPPVFGTFENALAGSWVLALMVLLMLRKLPALRDLGVALSLAPIAVIWFGLRFDRSKFPLTISEASLWVDLHATVAWLAFGGLTIAFVVALVMLLRQGRRFPGSDRLPPSISSDELAQDVMGKYVTYGFVMLTATLATGSYYEFLTFGRWWRWDPVESLTLCAWFLCSLYIHLRRTFGWRGTSLAWLVVIAMAALVVAYWLLAYLPPGTTFHVFDLGTRLHIE